MKSNFTVISFLASTGVLAAQRVTRYAKENNLRMVGSEIAEFVKPDGPFAKFLFK